MPEDAARVNLSYVLHEPSTSRQVGQYAARARRAIPILDRDVRRLSGLSDPEVASRTLVLAPEGEPGPGANGTVLTVQVGAWRLLGQVLAARRGSPGAPWHVQPLDDPACADAAEATFFRGPARLCLPGAADLAAAWFAALTIRPGGRSLLLELTPLAGPDGRDRAVRAAEAAIRSHVGQWVCSVPLWPRPAEEQLPEFLTA